MPPRTPRSAPRPTPRPSTAERRHPAHHTALLDPHSPEAIAQRRGPDLRLVPPALAMWLAVTWTLHARSALPLLVCLVFAAAFLPARVTRPFAAAASCAAVAAGCAFLRVLYSDATSRSLFPHLATVGKDHFRGRVQVSGSPSPLSDGGVKVSVALPDLGEVPLFLSDKHAAGAVHASELQPGQTIHIAATVAPSDRAGLVPVILRAQRGITEAHDPQGFWAVTSWLREGLTSTAASLPGEGAQIIPGTVVGDVSMQTPASREDFIATGLSHLTAVSGANVAIVTGAAVAACLTLGFHRRWALTAAAVALAGYVALVGPEPSVLRAGVMGTVGLVAMLTAHWSDILAALSAAVIVLSLLMPGQVVTYAFCLSVIATLGIVVLSPWIAKKVLRGWKQVCECHWDRFPTQAEAILVRMVCVAIAADIVTLPIIVHMTGKISIVAVVANVAVAWAVPIVTLTGLLAAPLCALATHTVLPDWFGRLTLAPAAPPANWIVWVADHLARIPMILTPGGWPWTLLLLANLALSIATIRWWRSWRFWRWSWLFLGLIWAFAWRWGILSFDISYPVTM